MITALNMNPSIDRMISVAEFQYGSMNRVRTSRDIGSGKAVNLSTVTGALGAATRCIGLLPEEGAQQVERRLSAHGVQTDFVRTKGRLRINIKLLDESRSIVTEINERGERVSQADLDRLGELVRREAERSDFMVFTGSLPPGCPEGYYGELMRQVSGRCRCVLDAEGAPFSLGLCARPFLVKPNRLELELAMGRKLGSLPEVRDAALLLCAKGVSYVAVSLGADGALLTDGREVRFAPALDLQVRSTVGAGDSMLGGMIVGLAQGEPLETVLRMGVAAASASVVSDGEPLVAPETYHEMLEKITIQRL